MKNILGKKMFWDFNSWYKGKGYSYKFIIKSLLFTARITNDAKTIFILCSILNVAKTATIPDKNYKTLVVVNPDEITNWELANGSYKG